MCLDIVVMVSVCLVWCWSVTFCHPCLITNILSSIYFVNSIDGAFQFFFFNLTGSCVFWFLFFISNALFTRLLPRWMYLSLCHLLTHLANGLICLAGFCISFSIFPFRSWAKVICLCLTFSFSGHWLIVPENFRNLQLTFYVIRRLWVISWEVMIFWRVAFLCLSCSSVSGLWFESVWICLLLMSWSLVVLGKEKQTAFGPQFLLSSVFRQPCGCAYFYF